MTPPALPCTHHFKASCCKILFHCTFMRVASLLGLATLCCFAHSGFACVLERPLKVLPEIRQSSTVHSAGAASKSSMQMLHLHRKSGLLRKFTSQNRAA